MIAHLTEAFTPELLNGTGVAALVVGLFWMLATGRLVTRREADTIKSDRDEWRAAFVAEQANGRVLSSQVTELLEHARVTERLLGALSELSTRENP